jgi:general secretion pathway protein G
VNTKVRQSKQAVRATSGNDQGFTLVELLIVIVVLGILSGIVVFGVGKFQANATTAACKADVTTVSLAADAFDATTGAYPADVATLVTGGYLKAAPTGGTYTFASATKTVTRAPVC